jgi:hypothetical protein
LDKLYHEGIFGINRCNTLPDLQGVKDHSYTQSERADKSNQGFTDSPEVVGTVKPAALSLNSLFRIVVFVQHIFPLTPKPTQRTEYQIKAEK